MENRLKLLDVAASCIGIREKPGAEIDNPAIMRMFAVAGHSWVNSEETPWCSAAMCYFASEAGLPHTGSLRARSWLDCHGRQVDRAGLRPGHVVVLWRESRSSSKGHVGLFTAERDGEIHLLGGNQNNSVCVKAYPRYRFLAGFDLEPGDA